ncbi:uncharacterized protein METZ01_LOCUS116001 [marine metagenome]|uniref:Uncharacterized protein n=1 Tax=marine metagenome TaxID=408172 RepID=A0A381XG55_9ZZZZ
MKTERRNRAEQILLIRFWIESVFAATCRTPSIGRPILLKIEAYARIAIPTARTPILAGPSVLAR